MVPLAVQLTRVRDAAERVWREPPREVVRLYLGIGRAGAGPIPQTFTTWVYVREDTRWICQHALPPLIGMLAKGDLSRKQLRFVAEELFRGEADFLAWLGLPELAGFIEDFVRRLATESSSPDLVALGHAIEGYTHRLQNWTTHYFPWGLGALFPQREPGAQESLIRRALERGTEGDSVDD